MEIKLPTKCGECVHVGSYTYGPFKRNPHYCCELIWTLVHEDYVVDPEVIDRNCPLRNIDLLKIIENTANSLHIKIGGLTKN